MRAGEAFFGLVTKQIPAAQQVPQEVGAVACALLIWLLAWSGVMPAQLNWLQPFAMHGVRGVVSSVVQRNALELAEAMAPLHKQVTNVLP